MLFKLNVRVAYWFFFYGHGLLVKLKLINFQSRSLNLHRQQLHVVWLHYPIELQSLSSSLSHTYTEYVSVSAHGLGPLPPVSFLFWASQVHNDLLFSFPRWGFPSIFFPPFLANSPATSIMFLVHITSMASSPNSKSDYDNMLKQSGSSSSI